MPVFVDAINGALIVGGKLEAGSIMYSLEPDSEPDLAWQWLRSEAADGTYAEIPGATAKTYITTSADLNQYINVSVTATGSATGSALSDPVKIGQLVLKPFRPIAGFYPVKDDGTPSSPFAAGSGTKSDPYMIRTADQFMLLKSNTVGTYFELENDIDLTAKGTITERFYGFLEGNNHLVTIRSQTGNGLFHEIVSGASIYNLRVGGRNRPLVGVYLESCSKGNLANYNYGTISGCSIENFDMQIYNGTNVRVGGLVGKNFGLIEKCRTSGNLLLNLVQCDAINGHYPSLADDLLSDWNKGWGGGLVGINMDGGLIRNCFSHMNVAVDSPGDLTYGISGGLAAVNEGDISFCYSTGAVSKNKWCGGLVGINNSPAKVMNSYFDREFSGRSDDNGKGSPENTLAMKTQSTFVGWSTEIWKFSSNRSDYPVLK